MCNMFSHTLSLGIKISDWSRVREELKEELREELREELKEELIKQCDEHLRTLSHQVLNHKVRNSYI